MNWLDDLADLLQSSIIGKDIYFETIDKFDKDCVSITSQGGAREERHSGGIILYNGSVSIKVRNFDMEACKGTADVIYQRLLNTRGVYQGSTYFKRFDIVGEPYHVSTDQNDGTIYSLNIDIQYER